MVRPLKRALLVKRSAYRPRFVIREAKRRASTTYARIVRVHRVRLLPPIITRWRVRMIKGRKSRIREHRSRPNVTRETKVENVKGDRRGNGQRSARIISAPVVRGAARFSRSRASCWGRKRRGSPYFSGSPAGATSRSRYSSTPIARTGRLPPFFFASSPPCPPINVSVCLARAAIHDRAWHTHLDDQLDLGHVAVTGAVLVAVVRHPERDLGSRRKEEGTFVSVAFLVGSRVYCRRRRRRFPPTLGDSRWRMETGQSKKRTKHDGSSRDTDAARVAPRSRR